MKRFFIARLFFVTAVAAVALGVAAPKVADAGSVNLENIKAVAISAITPVKAAPAEDISTLKMKSIKAAYMANARFEAIKAGEAPNSVDAGSVETWLTKVDASKVNMVTNRVHTNLSSADFDGMTYFVDGDMGSFSMKQNPSSHMAIDPVTNAMVDKANATTMADASGRVYYFASESSVNEFFAKAASNVAYGYSSAK